MGDKRRNTLKCLAIKNARNRNYKYVLFGVTSILVDPKEFSLFKMIMNKYKI